MTINELLKGRSAAKCSCGRELNVEQFKSDDGRTIGRFIPCKCGSEQPIYIEPGSIIAGFEGVSILNVWGPAKKD